jgi:hypothetical protein
MSTFALRQKLIDIARKDVGKTEVTKNQAPWIAKYWPATTYPDGMDNREPYCAAAQAYCLREWLKLKEVLTALGMTKEQAEKWRCKSASVFKASDSWLNWAKSAKGVKVLPKNSILPHRSGGGRRRRHHRALYRHRHEHRQRGKRRRRRLLREAAPARSSAQLHPVAGIGCPPYPACHKGKTMDNQGTHGRA